jgi:hypothetical protein
VSTLYSVVLIDLGSSIITIADILFSADSNKNLLI